jgi:hypothetical protein
MENLALTRYLFSYIEVRHTLFVCILEKKYEEALYWGYELYYSGYKDCTYEYLLKIYNELFIKRERMEERLIDEYNKWKRENELDEILGTIIINLCNDEYDISKFTEKYLTIKCKKKEDNRVNDSKLFILLGKKDIEKYKTLYLKGKMRNVLKNVYKYELRSEYNDVFETEKIDINERREAICMNWEVYAYRTPYWRSLIDEYKGRIVENKIVFENDDYLEEFYEKYYLDMDEQGSSIQNIALGINNKKSRTIKEFIKDFNGVMTKKKKKISTIIKTEED